MLGVLGIVHVGGGPGDGERNAVAGGVHPHAALAARLEPQVEGAAQTTARSGPLRPAFMPATRAAGLHRRLCGWPPVPRLLGAEPGKGFAVAKAGSRSCQLPLR